MGWWVVREREEWRGMVVFWVLEGGAEVGDSLASSTKVGSSSLEDVASREALKLWSFEGG